MGMHISWEKIGVDYIKMDLRKMGRLNAGWTEMAQVSFQWTAFSFTYYQSINI
jgi:hypothetical protein